MVAGRVNWVSTVVAVAAVAAAAVAAGAIVTACGSEPAPRTAAGPSLLGAAASGRDPQPFPSPAAWRYQPREAPLLLGRMALPGGGTVFVGQRGERWLVRATGAVAEAAPDVAPEDLVAVVASKDGGFLFLGRSGTSYEAREPVGPFVRASAPLEPLLRVHTAGSVLVGVRRDGALVRSDTGGAAWSRVGPEAVRFEDLAIGPDGHGLALGVPESYWATHDFGASFVRIETPSLGGASLIVDDAASVVVGTALGPYRWARDAAPPFASLGRLPAPPSQKLGADLPIGPSAAALAGGRAIVLKDRWIEVRPASESSYLLVSGTFGASLVSAPFPLVNRCASVRLAGSERALYIACARHRTPAVTQSLEVHRSVDAGVTWKVEPYVVEGRTSELAMAVAADGALVVSGVCSVALRGPGCRPLGVQRRDLVAGDAGPNRHVTLVTAATPSLAGSPLGLVASLDGRVLYALGQRSKGDSLAVFVSRDGGFTFDAREVPSLAVPESDGRTRGSGSVALESLAAAEDGTVAFVVSRGGGGGSSWIVVDEDGRTLGVSRPPAEGARVGAVGQRGIAVNTASRDAWESLDGGATFVSIGKVPVNPCPGAAACAPAVACVARGCVVGDVVSRIGFREAPRVVMLAPPDADHGTGRLDPRVGSPLACSLDAGEWRKLPGALGPPSADQSAIGRVGWFMLRHDPATTAVSVTHARLGREGAVEDVPLFPPAKRGVKMAYTASIQIEGVAAVRYPLPGTVDPRDPNLRQVEVAWDDALFGRVGHGVIPDGGPYRTGDYNNKGDGRIASAALVSIASGGVYVRLHESLGDAQPTFFVDGRAAKATPEVVPPVVWPAEASRRGRAEMARVGRAHLPIRIDGATLMRARQTARGAWAFDAVSVGFADPQSFGLVQHSSIAYAGEAAGLHVQTSDALGKTASSLLYPFTADGRGALGEPVRVPTQLDLPAAPRPCGAADKTATPRVVGPFQPGTRHPILVTDPVEPLRVLLTDDAVLHGTPELPCVAAYDAILVSSEAAVPGVTELGIVFVDPAERSWLFRSSRASREAAATVEYRGMSCRFDPTADVPIEVFREKGTLIPPR